MNKLVISVLYTQTLETEQAGDFIVWTRRGNFSYYRFRYTHLIDIMPVASELTRILLSWNWVEEYNLSLCLYVSETPLRR
jgi:hypothetical protein